MKELPTSSCRNGYTYSDITALLGDREPSFWKYMTGQTMGICEGKHYHHNREHDDSCRNPSSYILSRGYKPHEDDSEFEWFCGYAEGGYYEDTECAGNPHGVVVYSQDLKRFLMGLPVLD
jgi:hypothetical protein